MLETGKEEPGGRYDYRKSVASFWRSCCVTTLTFREAEAVTAMIEQNERKNLGFICMSIEVFNWRRNSHIMELPR